MKSPKSHIARELKEFLITSTLTAFLYLLINLVLLSILNLRGLWDVFINPSTGPINSQDISPLTDAFNSLQTKLDTPFVYLFWIFIGCLAYSIVWGLQSAITVSKREVEESRFLGADELRKTDYWRSTMTTNLLLLTSAVSTAIYVILYLRFLLPGLSKLFYRGLYSPSHYHGVIYVLVSIIAGAAALYLFVLLCRVLRYHWHTIRPT